MTVIKAFNNEKKPIDNEPLVTNAVVGDVEAAAGAEETDAPILMMRARSKRASTITTVLLLLAWALVFTIALCGAFYIYKQFMHVQRYRTTCFVPYSEDVDNDFNAYQERLTQDSSNVQEPQDVIERQVELFKFIRQVEDTASAMFQKALSAERVPVRPKGKSFQEDLELDSNGIYEKMYVPEFERGRNSKFIHDFSANMTGIIDVAGERCFVMPLDRNVVLPPLSLKDLIQKMTSGYYTVNPDQLSEKYRAVESSLEDMNKLGPHISQACESYPVYKLEKLVTGVYKRSVADDQANKAFTVLDGVQPRAIEIVNIENLPQAVQK